jgi:hypothetical protein
VAWANWWILLKWGLTRKLLRPEVLFEEIAARVISPIADKPESPLRGDVLSTL